MPRIAAAALMFALTAPFPVLAADRPGDPMAGAAQAQQLCSACHVVSPQGSGGTDMAPTLPSVAESRSDAALEMFLSAPHGNMPPVSLTRQQIADIVAYLGTIRSEATRTPPAKPRPGAGS